MAIRDDQMTELLEVLRIRFLKNMHLHEGLSWEPIEQRLLQQPQKLFSLSEMERTGGDPTVTGYDQDADTYLFIDCSPESPIGRRSLCYDQFALEKRKNNPPEGSAEGKAQAMGIELLDEKEYHDLQKLGNFDVKTSSWLRTPQSMRSLGGALFGDCRYDRVFVYHNGADSYYASRGFRGLLRV